MRTFLLAAALVAFPTLLSAQRSLAELQRTFEEAARALDKGQPTEAQRRALAENHVKDLAAFVEKDATGDDRWNGRLRLAEFRANLDDRDGALAALRGIDIESARPLLLVGATPLLHYLGARELKEQWLAKALERDAPLADRLAMARILMTPLHEVERSEAVFAAALASAGGDEERAQVRFQRADALRDREDLPENAGFDELDKLAQELPNTYWGSVAQDRLRATRITVGDRAIRITCRTRGGDEVSLQKLAGKVVVLAFWSARDYDTPELVRTLGDLQKKHGDALFVLGVALDRDPALIDAAIRDLAIPFAVTGDGKGADSDLALRWFAGGPTIHVIDREGKVAALGQHVGTADARADLAQAVQNARH